MGQVDALEHCLWYSAEGLCSEVDARFDMVRVVWCGVVWCGVFGVFGVFGVVWFGVVWCGLVWFGVV